MKFPKFWKIDYVKDGSFFKRPNMFWELQISTEFESGPYFDFTIKWTRNEDHAGFNFKIEILSFYFCFQIYDCRHWDYDNDSWESYDVKQ